MLTDFSISIEDNQLIYDLISNLTDDEKLSIEFSKSRQNCAFTCELSDDTGVKLNLAIQLSSFLFRHDSKMKMGIAARLNTGHTVIIDYDPNTPKVSLVKRDFLFPSFSSMIQSTYDGASVKEVVPLSSIDSYLSLIISGIVTYENS